MSRQAFSALALHPARPFGSSQLAAAMAQSRSRSRATMPSSSAAAVMAWAPPITSPRSTVSPISPCSRRAGSAAATPAATPPSSARTTCSTKAPRCTTIRVKLWENLSQVLNYNVMFSPRGVMMLAHTVHDIQVFKRHVHANRCNGVDNEWLEPGTSQGVLSAAQHRETTSAIRCSARPCSAAAAPRATTRWPGVMHAPPMRSASISSRTAR